MSDKKDVEKNIEDLLKKITEIDYEEEAIVKNPLHVSSVASAVEQYLTPFILFGYDVNGDSVVITNAHTQRDYDSVMLSVGRYLAQQKDIVPNDDIGDIMGDEEI